MDRDFSRNGTIPIDGKQNDDFMLCMCRQCISNRNVHLLFIVWLCLMVCLIFIKLNRICKDQRLFSKQYGFLTPVRNNNTNIEETQWNVTDFHNYYIKLIDCSRTIEYGCVGEWTRARYWASITVLCWPNVTSATSLMITTSANKIIIIAT